MSEVTFFDLSRAKLCVVCEAVSNATTETCPRCKAELSLLDLWRPLNPSPEFGQIDFIKLCGQKIAEEKTSQCLNQQ